MKVIDDLGPENSLIGDREGQNQIGVGLKKGIGGVPWCSRGKSVYQWRGHDPVSGEGTRFHMPRGS